jgi:murein DD-endopeptidase MepM/ murein hydrolase activator NlpD
MVFSGRAGAIRRFQIERKRVRALGIVAGLLAVLAPLLLVDYVRLRFVAVEKDRLSHETRLQRAELDEYAAKVGQISEALGRVAQLDRKLRVMADLDPANALALPGIGGIEGGLEPLQMAALSPQGRRQRILEQFSQLEGAAAEQGQRLEQLVSHLEEQTARLAATPSIAPARGWITSDFGYRTSPFTGTREFHRGVDIAARKGTPIVSPAQGRVHYVGEHKALGKTVVLRHGYGIETVYGHLSEVGVKTGELVKRGQTVALMGNTGRSTGPHLHYQVQVNGVPVDPQNYILD